MNTKTSNRLRVLWAFLFALLLSLHGVSASAGEAAPENYEFVLPIRTEADDLEERVSDGTADAGSFDIELGYEDPGGGDKKAQIVGLRFTDVPILSGAVITEAYIQFTVDEVKYPADPFDVTIAVEDAADSAPFGEGDVVERYALSSRAVMAQSVRWATGEGSRIVWKTVGKAGKAQRTPDLSALMQAVIDRDGWAYGNAVTFLISGVGNRTAFACERDSDRAAALHVSFTIVNAGQAPPDALAGTAPATLLEDDGAITGTTALMEYRPADEPSAKWTPCGGESITGLTAGDYEVRYAARMCYNASEAVRVNIPLYPGDLTLQPGADETQMNFAWYQRDVRPREAIVQIAPAAAGTNGEFPLDAAQTFTGESAWIEGEYRAFAVTATGLAPRTDYVYRLGDGGNWSGVYRFSTRDSENYCAILIGDPQLGASGDAVADSLSWAETVARSMDQFPDASFMLSMGDHVQASGSETQYELFFAPMGLRSMPFVPTVGNHDDNRIFGKHFNVPNESRYGRTVSGHDYWFAYGNTLYMVLNSNNRSAPDHDAFMERAIAEAGENAVWKVVMFHHAIYSSASHSAEIGILSLRDMLHPLMDKHGIDVVLTGHDHCYTRSYQMLGDEAVSGLASVAVNPAGTVYITTGTASGSKVYPLLDVDAKYRAVRWPDKESSYSSIAISEAAFSITTFSTSDNEVIDRYTILKDQSAPANLEGVAPTAADVADGRIDGTAGSMEYRRTSDAGWTPCGDGSTAGLAPGTYAVRYRATETRAAGAAATVNVPGYLQIN